MFLTYGDFTSQQLYDSFADLPKAHFFGHMCPMGKKAKEKSDLARLRDGLNMSQPEFARCIGISASMIKKLEEGKREMSPDVISRIFAETGVMFSNSIDNQPPLEYSKTDHQEWKNLLRFNDPALRAAAGTVTKLVDLMLDASNRPGVDKTFPVLTALHQAIEKVKNEFRLEKHVDALLRERHSTETKVYIVRELRDNDLLAKQTGFNDDRTLKDDDKITLARPVGWLPSKDFFNILWQQREFLSGLARQPDSELSEEAKTQIINKCEQFEKQIDDALSASYPNLR